MNILEELNKRVAESARQLDRDMPGWHKKIDLATFGMHDPDKCVAAQLGIGDVLNRQRCFGYPEDLQQNRGGLSDYENLTSAWRGEIEGRLKQFCNPVTPAIVFSHNVKCCEEFVIALSKRGYSSYMKFDGNHWDVHTDLSQSPDLPAYIRGWCDCNAIMNT